MCIRDRIKAVDIDIVVRAGRHFCEGDVLLVLLEIVDIHNFRIFRRITAHQGVRQGVGRIQRRQTGDPQKACLTADLHTVTGRVAALGSCLLYTSRWV